MPQIDVEYFGRTTVNSIHCAYHCHWVQLTVSFEWLTTRPTAIHKPAKQAFSVPSNAIDNWHNLHFAPFPTHSTLNGPLCRRFCFLVCRRFCRFRQFSQIIKTNKTIFICNFSLFLERSKRLYRKWSKGTQQQQQQIVKKTNYRTHIYARLVDLLAVSSHGTLLSMKFIYWAYTKVIFWPHIFRRSYRLLMSRRKMQI